MRNSILNNVTDDLLATLPLILRIFRKKLFKLTTIIYEGISPLHHEIMKTLEKEGKQQFDLGKEGGHSKGY